MGFYSSLLILFFINTRVALGAIGPDKYQYLTGKNLSKDMKGQWDLLFGRSTFVYGKKPVLLLADYYHLIPAKGRVLDIGMGEGRNAVFLAQKGYQVTGIDISEQAIKKALSLAKENTKDAAQELSLKVIQADITSYRSFDPNSFDAILCFYFVERSIIEEIKTWLRPGGYLFFEANYVDKIPALEKNIEIAHGSINKKQFESFSTIEKQELKKLFPDPDFQFIKHDELRIEHKNITSAIARKTSLPSVTSSSMNTNKNKKKK